ncbi:hypothetical protein Tco_1013167 [Tanacetum coccineum]
MYVSPPSITIVRPWFTTIGYSRKIRTKGSLKKSYLPPRWRLLMDYAKLIWEDIIHKLSKKTREKVVPYPRFISLLLEYMMPEYDNEELNVNLTQVSSVYNWALKPNQTEGPPFTDHIKAICNLDVHVDSKAPKPSLQTEETEASKSKTGQSKKETQFSSTKDKSPSHPSPPTPVVGEIHKEAQQATDGPTSLGATSKEGAHPQLSSGHDALADSTAKADPVLSAPNNSIPTQQDQTKSDGDGLKTTHTDSGINEESRADDISKKIKLEDLSDLLKDTRSTFFTLDSPQDEPIIVSDESEEEEEVAKDKDTHAFSHNSQKDELEEQKAKDEAEVASLKARPSYPDINQLTNLLLPSKFTELSGEIKELKKHVQDMEIELPVDLKEIPTKMENFTSTISSLSSQEKLKTLDSLPSLLNKVTNTLNRFATVVENASGATTKGVPSTGQATALPTEEEKNTNPAITDDELNLYDELVDLLGIDVVTQYYNKKLLYDKNCDKMLKRRKGNKITNCDVLTQKGPISLKLDREDGTSEAISNIKVSDLHLANGERMEYLDQTEKEPKIDFNKPLKKQDPLNELNDLANTKRKRTGDSTNHSRSTKKHKSSVQHEEEFELLKFLQRQLFRSLEDWEVSSL